MNKIDASVIDTTIHQGATVTVTLPLDATEPLQNALYDTVLRLQADLAGYERMGRAPASVLAARADQVRFLKRQIASLDLVMRQVGQHV